MKDITKYWYARQILDNCVDLLHLHMDRRKSLVAVAHELSLATDDKTLDEALSNRLFLLQQKLGVGPLAEHRGAVEDAVATLSDEEVLKVYREIESLTAVLRSD